MFSMIRKHFRYTNVVLTLALVFAMTGGAYAAGKYLITSTKQISPKVLKALTGKSGAKGSAGPAGPAGAPGAKGETGAPGSVGKEGAAGKNGVNGESVTVKEVKTTETACAKQGGSSFTVSNTTTDACNGKEGKEGSPWTVGGTLPSGQTETGVWSAIYTVTAAGQLMSSPISFTIPLKAEAEAHFIGTHEELAGEPNEAAAIKEGKCKGNWEKPEAKSGNVCVFARLMGETKFLSILNMGPYGIALLVFSEEPASPATSWAVTAGGTWAVTA